MVIIGTSIKKKQNIVNEKKNECLKGKQKGKGKIIEVIIEAK